MGKVLIVAFDGMDIDLMKEYKCSNLLDMKEFGTLNNSKGISTIITNELWASFITGKTWKDHGIISKNRPESNFLFKIEKFNRYQFFRNFMGLRRAIYENIPFLDSEIRRYEKKDLKSESLFDKIDKSKAIDVRSYNVGYNYDLMRSLETGVKEASKDLEKFTKWKKWELFDEMEKNHNLIMAHFHKPDHIHHWYWEVGKMDKVEETYHEVDEFAGEILEKAEENGFDTIIFVSDHGLPDVENGGHNENAFYSCNHELFGDKTPHITDFHDKILNLVSKEQEEIEEIDF